jgi:hypothetical protein
MAYAQLRRHPELVALSFILLAASLASAPILLYGAPFGHDTIYHQSWLHAFSSELSAGEWYPRWLHELNGGAGSPSFFFFGPVPFYISALFNTLLCPGCEPATQLAVGTWILLLASGFALYALARDYARPWVAAIGAIAYMLMPYHFEIDLWRRVAFGEFSVYICMPLVLLFLQRTLRDTRYLPALALSYAGLVASHIPAAMLFSLFLGGYTLLLCYAQKSLRPVAYAAAGVVLGVGLAAIYLVPALAEQHYIAALRYFTPGYAPPHQLWNYEYFNYANWLFMDGRPERYNSFGTRIFHLLIGTTVVALLLIVAACEKDRLKKVRELSPWILGLAFVWFMVTPLSIPVWELFADLRKISFPWRSIMVADLATAMLFVIAFETVATHRRAGSLLSLLLATALFAILLLSGERTHPGQPPYLKELAPFQKSATLDEFDRNFRAGYDALEYYMPVWVEKSADEFRSTIAAIPNLAVISATGDASIVRWASRDILLRVRLDDDARLVVKQFYYPGWNAQIVGTGETLKLAPSAKTGLVELHAPRGSYDISLRLEPLWPERAGTALSLVSLLVLAILFLANIRNRHRADSSQLQGRLSF